MEDKRRRRRDGTRAAMKRLSEIRRCPECARGYAIKRLRIDLYTTIRVCRWCGYRKVFKA